MTEQSWPFESLLEQAGAPEDELVSWMSAIHAITRPETVLVLAPMARDEDRSGMFRTEAIRLIESFPRPKCSC